MKIENKEVSIKIGKKEKTFRNLILNNYLNLFSESFLDFKNKDLRYCLLNFTKTNNITEDSTTMLYDTVLTCKLTDIVEILTEKKIINKYTYLYEEGSMYNPLSNYIGQKLKQIGFGMLNESTGDFIIYAYLDVINHNIFIKDKQPLIISRLDKIETDMDFYTNSENVKAPIHLTMRGILDIQGYEYTQTVTKLESIGLSNNFEIIEKEYTNIKTFKNNVGKIRILQIITNNESIKYKYLIYKFKLFKVIYENPESSVPTYVDTGLFYYQYKRIDKIGNLKLLISYERK